MSWYQRSTHDFHASRHCTLKHELHKHPMLQMESLKALALRHPTVKFHSANLDPSQSLETVVKDRPSGHSLKDALDNIETSGTFVFIQNIQTDPVYGPFVNEVLDELEKDVHRTHKNMRNRQAWVFITSPGGLTPYHRDQEASHYFHVKGEKTFWLWDEGDREVVTQAENEYFHGVYGLSKTKYREAHMEKAMSFNIHPGDGIYFPYTWPHMVKNGDKEFSISISFTHMTDEDFSKRRLNKMNQLIRKMGLNPRDVGVSRFADRTKLATHWALRNTLGHVSGNWRNA